MFQMVRTALAAALALLLLILLGCQDDGPAPADGSHDSQSQVGDNSTSGIARDENPPEVGADVTDPISPKPDEHSKDGDAPKTGYGSDDGHETETGHGDAVDPVKANGPIFEGWPKPKLAIVFSGQQNGYMEPCGCAGLENMKGGLKRRYSLFEQMRKRDWPLLALDVGGLVRRFGRQAEMKFNLTVDSLKTMGYSAIGFGPHDLNLPVDALLGTVIDQQNGFTSANVVLLGDASLLPTYQLIEEGGYTVGVVSVLGSGMAKDLGGDEVQVKDPAEALAPIVEKLRDPCDVMILLSHAKQEESRQLAEKFMEFDYILTADSVSPPPAQPTKLEGDRWLIEVGNKGMFVGVLGLFDDKDKPRRYQRVPIDARFKDAQQMQLRMVALQDQLKQIVETGGWAGLGIKPVPHPSSREFVGSQTCGECHTKAMEVFKNTPHSHATQSIVNLQPPRHFDPECLSCHVTGWEPQKFYPYTSGFTGLEDTPHLTDNGCENCHGPGSHHVAIEMGELDVDEAEQQKAREQMRLTLEEAKKSKCSECHDLDNSPDYVKLGFEEYWPKVEHKGKD